MNRDVSLRRVGERGGEGFDLVVIGGGATGMGIGVDGASRGYSVVVLEGADFGKGTSSRSTKLIHGGVRYLQQGNIALVMEALKERGILRGNAGHLVHDLGFVVPNYAWWETPFYGIGMKVYDLLAGKFGFGRSRVLSKAEVLARIPTLEEEGLRGGVLYFDGQFDDARLLIDLARTADGLGAVVLNYARVTGLLYDGEGYVNGLEFVDGETGVSQRVLGKCVVNATGAFCDGVRRMDDAGAGAMIAPSQGVHVVLDRSFLPGEAAIMVPHTRDGRVMFAIPWRGHTLLGTTDTAVGEATLEPVATGEEVDFILETAGKYLHKRPGRGDVLSVFAGIRPLVKSGMGGGGTAGISREHAISVSKTGLLTIAGGKWTTYRKMAEEAVNHAITLGGLEERACVTAGLKIHGHDAEAGRYGSLAHYGSAAREVLDLIAGEAVLGEVLHGALPVVGAEVVQGVRREMARTVEDVLARRTRALFLNAKAAMEMAAGVGRLMARELGRDERWVAREVEAFGRVAGNYVVA